MKYRVLYYSRRETPNKPVHKKGGVWTRTFTDRAKAEAFAADHQVYGRPCRVEEIPEDPGT